jgi:hypothetical protein
MVLENMNLDVSTLQQALARLEVAESNTVCR